MKNSDYARPRGINEGVLLNTNNDALSSYKKAKKRMSSITKLEDQVIEMKEQLKELQRLVYANSTN